MWEMEQEELLEEILKQQPTHCAPQDGLESVKIVDKAGEDQGKKKQQIQYLHPFPSCKKCRKRVREWNTHTHTHTHTHNHIYLSISSIEEEYMHIYMSIDSHNTLVFASHLLSFSLLVFALSHALRCANTRDIYLNAKRKVTPPWTLKDKFPHQVCVLLSLIVASFSLSLPPYICIHMCVCACVLDSHTQTNTWILFINP